MDKLLKGNYELKSEENLHASDTSKDSTAEFEEQTMERLGGSIAFVMKGKKLIWDEDDEKNEK